ncbi:hypothetical protein ZIOFF_025489 [Zingiber officinale]|uniref:Uncharacterized protein n=1 Tax=Zingiber officinale TaxID=94328 RepID=A0A8J5LEM7_ZINOF|nr:hypothetical protein ZIOFF_025489 [Zingiber officinale]
MCHGCMDGMMPSPSWWCYRRAIMVETKMVVVAFLLVAMLVASSAPAAEATCFLNCYARCANGKVGDTSCNNMCMQACVIPTSISTDGSVNFDVSLTGGVN